ncbi:MAG: OmpA family protein [Pseudomonadota bacterium]|nr:OmpA family protein [Pseudomonadota bacterium]
MIALLALVATHPAHAQDVPDVRVDAQLYRLPVDATSTLWADDSHLAPGASARIAVGYLKEPFVWIWDDTGERVAVVDNVLGIDAIAGFSAWRIRGAVDVPIYPVATGALRSGGGLGDIAVDVKGVALDREAGPVGLALGARLTIPTNTTSVALGGGGVGWEISAIVDKRAGPLVLAANLGHRGVPDVDLGALGIADTLGDRFVYRAGVGFDTSDRAGLSLDLAGHLAYADVGNPAARSLEAMLGGWVRVADPLVVRGGLGRGLAGGIGSPTVRAVVALAWEPSAKPAPKPKVAAVAATKTPAAATKAPAAATKAPAGTTRAPTKPASPAFLEVPGLSTLAPGIVHIEVVDAQGSPVAATWAFGTVARGAVVNGLGMAKVSPGPWSILVSAEGYATQGLSIDVDTGMTTGVEVVLLPARLSVRPDRIELLEKIQWSGTIIDSASEPILDEMAAVLRAHPELLTIRIEGHTDSRGPAEDNLSLSGARAAAVMAALVDRGLDPNRLVAAGYGEARPLDWADNPVAWERNQRIELVVTGRAP